MGNKERNASTSAPGVGSFFQGGSTARTAAKYPPTNTQPGGERGPEERFSKSVYLRFHASIQEYLKWLSSPSPNPTARLVTKRGSNSKQSPPANQPGPPIIHLFLPYNVLLGHFGQIWTDSFGPWGPGPMHRWNPHPLHFEVWPRSFTGGFDRKQSWTRVPSSPARFVQMSLFKSIPSMRCSQFFQHIT